MDNEIIIYKGDTKTITATFTDSAGDAYDLTGKRVIFTMKKNAKDSDDIAVIQKTFTDGDSTGIATFSLTNSDTDQTEGQYPYNIRLVTSGKGTVSSTEEGIIKIKKGITQTVPSF